jgi:UMF1 family MFS transporter
MVSISVLVQAIVFITVGALGDYGNYRRRGMVLGSTAGAYHLLTIVHVFTPHLSCLM